jgi:uncharacterized protein YqcC (DUF446 family)
MNYSSELYTLAITKADEIEAELKRINRWSAHELSSEKFENMGAFGSNTMTFENWIQFILIPRIHAIVDEKGEFPDSSELAPYAIREFDGDPEAHTLHDLLYDLDKLINEKNIFVDKSITMEGDDPIPSVSIGDTEIPAVIFSLLEVLPQFEGEDLESQLQTYDAFLGFLAPSVRPRISNLLQEAADKTSNEISKVRIMEAARSVAMGGRAAAPYNHEEAMRRYREEHKKSFPL